jgi:hypothetical protein
VGVCGADIIRSLRIRILLTHMGLGQMADHAPTTTHLLVGFRYTNGFTFRWQSCQPCVSQSSLSPNARGLSSSFAAATVVESSSSVPDKVAICCL